MMPKDSEKNALVRKIFRVAYYKEAQNKKQYKNKRKKGPCRPMTEPLCADSPPNGYEPVAIEKLVRE
jgi:hypothetical protein